LKLYKIASQEAAELYLEEVEAEVELDLDAEQERALVAAGWLEPSKKKKEE